MKLIKILGMSLTLIAPLSDSDYRACIQSAKESTKYFANETISIEEVKKLYPSIVIFPEDLQSGKLTYLEFAKRAYIQIKEWEQSGQQRDICLASLLKNDTSNLFLELQFKYQRLDPDFQDQVRRELLADPGFQEQCKKHNADLQEIHTLMQQADEAKERARQSSLPSISEFRSMLCNCVGAARDIFQQAQGIHQQLQDAGLISSAATSSARSTQTAAQSASRSSAQSASRSSAQSRSACASQPAPMPAGFQSAARSAPRSTSSTVGADPTPEQIERACAYI